MTKQISHINPVYEVTQQIPLGKVLTYGAISKLTGIHPRQVGRILHANPDPSTTPCHRVVNSQGCVAHTFSYGGGEAQKQKLIAEGVVFKDDRVDLKTSLWQIEI